MRRQGRADHRRARGIGKGIAAALRRGRGAGSCSPTPRAKPAQATADELGARFIRTDISQMADAEAAVALALETPWPARHHRAECRHLSLAADREHQPRRLGPRHGGQSARQLQRRPRGAGADEGAGLRPHALHLLDHRAACHQPRPRPLFGEQGRHQRLHPLGGARILRLRHHRQRRRARQHPDRGHPAASRRRLHQEHGGRHPARPARQRRATSPTPSCSSPRTTPATSPARPSSSMAASCCPRARISGSPPAEPLALRAAAAALGQFSRV